MLWPNSDNYTKEIKESFRDRVLGATVNFLAVQTVLYQKVFFIIYP